MLVTSKHPNFHRNHQEITYKTKKQAEKTAPSQTNLCFKCHELRLVVYPIIYKVLAPSQVVVARRISEPSTVVISYMHCILVFELYYNILSYPTEFGGQPFKQPFFKLPPSLLRDGQHPTWTTPCSTSAFGIKTTNQIGITIAVKHQAILQTPSEQHGERIPFQP